MIVRPVGPTDLANSDWTYKRGFLLAYVNTLLEYDTTGGGDSSSTITIEGLGTDVLNAIRSANSIASLKQAISLFSDRLKALKYEETPAIEPLKQVVTGTAGLYVDSFVGARPGTEPYVDWMRLTEVQDREANVEVQLAKARQINASSLPSSSRLPDAKVSATAVNLRTLRLRFTGDIPNGEWDIVVDGSLTQEILDSDGQDQYDIEYAQDQIWLTASEINYGLLIHRTLKVTIGFVI